MTRELVVDIATSWLGRKEADGSHREIIDIYNKQNPLPRGYRVKYTDAWCATFVSAVFLTAGMKDFPFECGCPPMIRGFQSRGQWMEDDSYHPKIGDVIFYDWKDSGVGDNTGQADHVGIVTAVNADSMIITEGNISNMVGTRSIKYNARYIRGFGLPDYGDGTTAETKPAAAETGSTGKTYTVKTGDSLWTIAANQLGDGTRWKEIKTLNGLTSELIHAGQTLKLPGTAGEAAEAPTSAAAETCTVTLPLLKRWHTGLSVKALQTLLTFRGMSVDVDGSFGEKTESAVKSFQTAAKILSDGEVGKDTWKALIG